MNSRWSIALIVCALLLGSLISRAEDGRSMNVVLIVIDDLGWRDLGCQGSTYYRTPNIDRLAAEGVRFTDAYAAASICSPTRAAILTGKYPARLLLTQWLPAGRWDAKKHQLREARYVRELPLEEVTLAEALREHGYSTGFIGKWHLGGAPFYLPEHQGFDVNVAGADHGAPGSYFHPYRGKWRLPTTNIDIEKQTLSDGESGEYLIDRLSEEASDFVESHADRPFFLMLSHYAVHGPLQAKPSMIERYQPIPEGERQGAPTYAAMVESVDQSVGNVVSTLEQFDLIDRTLIVFTSDNGGWANATDNFPLRANKGSSYEGGLRVPLIIRAPGTAAGQVNATPAISMDIYPTVLDVLGLSPRPHQHVDGISLLPALSGEATDARDLFWHYPHYNRHPHSAPTGVVRSGGWKMIEFFESGELELYDLESDIGEKINLAELQPDLVETLAARLVQWRGDVHADVMKPNPEFAGPNR